MTKVAQAQTQFAIGDLTPNCNQMRGNCYKAARCFGDVVQQAVDDDGLVGTHAPPGLSIHRMCSFTGGLRSGGGENDRQTRPVSPHVVFRDA